MRVDAARDELSDQGSRGAPLQAKSDANREPSERQREERKETYPMVGRC